MSNTLVSLEISLLCSLFHPTPKKPRGAQNMVSFNSEEMKHQNNRSEYHLHSLHKSSASRIMKKPPTSLAPAASGPQQPKVYKVKPIHFRELVQKLTGAQLKPQPQLQPQPQPHAQAQPRRSSLQSVAPAPLPLHPHQLRLQNQTQRGIVEERVPKVEHAQTVVPVEQKSWMDKMDGGDSSTELTLSPNFQAWFSFALLSPGPATVSQFEQRSVV